MDFCSHHIATLISAQLDIVVRTYLLATSDVLRRSEMVALNLLGSTAM